MQNCQILLETLQLNAMGSIIFIVEFSSPPDFSWVYLHSFILCYLYQLQISLNREVEVKQKNNLGNLKNRIMFSFAWINFLVDIAGKVLLY